MIRRLIKDSALYGMGQLIYLGLPILIIPVYSRFLDPREYGALELISAAGLLVNFVVTLEIGQGMGRYFIETKDSSTRAEYASTALLFSMTSYGVFCAIGLLITAEISTFLLGSLEWENSVQVGLVAICSTGLFIVFQNQLRWLMTPRPFLAAAIIHAITSTIVSVVLLTEYHIGPSAVLYGQIAGAALGSIVAGWYARCCYRLVFKVKQLHQMLTFSAPLVLSSISLFSMQFVDRYIIKDLIDITAVGVYSIGFRLASTANLLLLGLNASLTPLIYEKYREAETPAILAKIFRGFIAGTLPLLIAGSLFSKELLAIAVAPEYMSAWTVIPLLAFASVLARMYIFAPGIDIFKKTHIVMAINVGGALANIALCYALIPEFGIIGAALAAVVSAGAGFIAYMTFSQNLYPVPHDWMNILSATALACLIISLGIYLEPFASDDGVMRGVVKALWVLIGSSIIVWLMRRNTTQFV
jgi:O-antigen/teichoic acid export membrane protein